MELRNLSSVFLALLLLAPGVASAQTCPPPYLYCGERQYAPFLTSGTVTWTSEAVWNVSTPSIYKTVWTTTGFAVDVSDPTGLGIGHGIGPPIPSGKGFNYGFDTSEPFDSGNLSMTLTINDVLLPALGATVGLGIEGPDSGITHAGTYAAQFSFVASYYPCEFCTTWILSSGGENPWPGVLDVVPYPGVPNTFYVDKATFTFSSVPEPSTASLRLIGFAGLVVLGRRRRPAANFFPAS